jgi:hypothetical protein
LGGNIFAGFLVRGGEASAAEKDPLQLGAACEANRIAEYWDVQLRQVNRKGLKLDRCRPLDKKFKNLIALRQTFANLLGPSFSHVSKYLEPRLAAYLRISEDICTKDLSFSIAVLFFPQETTFSSVHPP